jgi:hypothetical protein
MGPEERRYLAELSLANNAWIRNQMLNGFRLLEYEMSKHLRSHRKIPYFRHFVEADDFQAGQ